MGGMTRTPPGRVTAVPRRMRLLCAVLGAVVVAVMAYVAVTLK
jgi:hypothetical protein